MLKIKLSTPCDSLFVIFICYMGDLISEANQQLDHCSLLLTTCFSHCLSLSCFPLSTTVDHGLLLLTTSTTFYYLPLLNIVLHHCHLLPLHYSYSLLLSTASSYMYSHSHTVNCLRLSSASQYKLKHITDNCLLLSI